MSLRDHLRELRSRVLKIAGGILVGTIGGWFPSGRVMTLLASPLDEVAKRTHLDLRLNFSGVGDPLDMKLKVALFLGIVVTSPWWTFQVWAFVTPGLTGKERRVTVGFILLAVPLFLAGVAMAWWAMPTLVQLFTDVTPSGAVNYVDAGPYMTFVTQIMLTLGGTFLLPLFMVALSAAGVVRGRTWLKGWRWAVVIIAFIAAIVTPSANILPMLYVAAPLLVLYYIAVGACLLLDRRADRRNAAFLEANLDLESG